MKTQAHSMFMTSCGFCSAHIADSSHPHDFLRNVKSLSSFPLRQGG